MIIEQRLGQKHPTLENPNGADNVWHSRNAEAKSLAREVDLFNTLSRRGTHVGKQRAELFPSLSASGQRAVTLQQDAQVVSQSAIDGVFKGKRQYLRRRFAFGDAARKRALAQGCPRIAGLAGCAIASPVAAVRRRTRLRDRPGRGSLADHR